MNCVIAAFSELKIKEHFPDDWERKVWSDGFISYKSFPVEFETYLEEVNICTLLNNLHEALRLWFQVSGVSLGDVLDNEASDTDTNHSANQTMTWQGLFSEGVEYKVIVCIIGTTILRFLDEPKNLEYFKEALVAIRLYSYLVAIPGSHVCQIFNSTLYSHVVSVIETCCEQIDNSAEKKRKGVKRKENNDDGQEKDETGESNQLCFDKTEIISLASDFLSNLKLILKNRKFRIDETSLNLTIQILLVITRLEKTFNTLLMHNENDCRKESVSHLAYKSFSLLLDLSALLHNNPETSAKLLLKWTLPVFLVAESSALGLRQEEATIVRSNYTYFLKLVLDKLGESAYHAIKILVQQICVNVPDRAEMRLKASLIILDIMKVSPPDLQAEEIHSIVFMSHMAETKIRSLTLEIIKSLLENDAISMTQLPQKYAAVTNDEFLLAVILFRCQDEVTSISAKALSYLDQLILMASTNRRAKTLIDKIFVEPYVNVENPEEVPVYSRGVFDTRQFLHNQQFLDDSSLNPLPGVKVILDLLEYLSEDDKVLVRKFARQTLGRIFMYNRMWIKMDSLQVFLIGCDDSSVLVRKTMSQILTDLLIMYPDHVDLMKCWVEGVVPMIADEDAKAQEKVIEHYCKIILNNIQRVEHTTKVVSRLPWLVMKEILDQKQQTYLHYAVGKWVQTGAIKKNTLQIIYSHFHGENNDIAWCFMVSLVQFMKLPKAGVIYEHYQRMIPYLDELPYSQMVLETLYYVCPNLLKEDKDKLFQQLEASLVDCTVPFKLIARSRDICEQILSAQASKKTERHEAVVQWSTPKIQACCESIDLLVGRNAPIDVQHMEMLMKHILMVGEFAQAAPKSIKYELINLLRNLLISPKKRVAGAWKGRVSNAVKAVIVLTLVKLVLQWKDTTKDLLPLFRDILRSSSVDPTIQINTIIGMCDLCSRYTSLVERYFPDLCRCFKSQHEAVRKTALVYLVKRIREEYVKLRPYIFFPMITMILDKSDDIKLYLATYINVDMRKPNNKILQTFFTGLFFFLNNYKKHSTVAKIPDDMLVTFSYADDPEIRYYIYFYILDKLADAPRRLQICKMIVNDILASVAEEKLDVDEKVEEILTDAFTVLVENEKKIFEAIAKNTKSNNEEVDDVEERGEQNKKSSQGQVNVTRALRLSEASEIMPVIIKLRLRLKQRRSRVTESLMMYVCELMRNFEDEVSTLLGSNEDLKAEVKLTLRREEKEANRERQKAINAVQAGLIEMAIDERNNVPVTETFREGLCEQIRSLISTLNNSSPPAQVEAEVHRLPASVRFSPRSRTKSKTPSTVQSKAPTPRRRIVTPLDASELPSPIPVRKSARPPALRSGNEPQTPQVTSPLSVPISPRSREKPSSFVSSTPLPSSISRSREPSPPSPSSSW